MTRMPARARLDVEHLVVADVHLALGAAPTPQRRAKILGPLRTAHFVEKRSYPKVSRAAKRFEELRSVTPGVRMMFDTTASVYRARGLEGAARTRPPPAPGCAGAHRPDEHRHRPLVTAGSRIGRGEIARTCPHRSPVTTPDFSKERARLS